MPSASSCEIFYVTMGWVISCAMSSLNSLTSSTSHAPPLVVCQPRPIHAASGPSACLIRWCGYWSMPKPLNQFRARLANQKQGPKPFRRYRGNSNMNGTILRQDDKYGGELSPEQREKILELIANLFAAEEPVTVSETFDQLLSPDILQYLQERLKDVQTSDEDISAILLEVALSLLQDAQMLGIDVVVARYLDERQRVID